MYMYARTFLPHPANSAQPTDDCESGQCFWSCRLGTKAAALRAVVGVLAQSLAVAAAAAEAESKETLSSMEPFLRHAARGKGALAEAAANALKHLGTAGGRTHARTQIHARALCTRTVSTAV